MRKLTDADPETKTADVIADNVAKLRCLFPEAFSEGRIDFEVLKQLLGSAVEEREEKYGLNWHGKRQARQIALTPSGGTLRPCPEESVDWDTTHNLMIEGDNLEVLKLLQKSYSGKVKLIYIDPPYNTGKDFVYPDNFQDNIKNYLAMTRQSDDNGLKMTSNTETSGRFHTDWLNMIYPRLKLARNLLTTDGVILMSIDDHEGENLRKVCDEVFGEENFIANMVWEKGRKNDAKFISVGHEYMLVYAKSLSHLREAKVTWREEKPGAREIWEKYIDLRNSCGKDDRLIEEQLQLWYSSLPKTHPSKKWSRYKRIDSNGPWRDRDISWPGGDGPRYDVPHPKTGLPCKVPDSGWRFEESAMKRQIQLGLVEFRNDHTEPPFRKAHIRPVPAEMEADSGSDDADDEGLTDEGEEEFATQVRGSYFYKQSQVAVKFLRGLMGVKAFNNPKDHVELARLFRYVTQDDPKAVILDFFAGSGSTAHATLELNISDGGSRRFIVVQLPEKLDPTDKNQKAAYRFCEKIGKPPTIAELTKERLRVTSRHIRENHPDSDIDRGFRVFELESSNIRAWSPDRDDLTGTLADSIEHLKSDRTEQDVLFELLLKLGLDLTVPIEQKSIAGKTVHSIGAGTLIVCLAPTVSRNEVEKLALGIVEWHKALAPAGDTTVVFRDSAFADDVAKTNLTAILEQYGLQNVRSL